jgi:hypothetical protein
MDAEYSIASTDGAQSIVVSCFSNQNLCWPYFFAGQD